MSLLPLLPLLLHLLQPAGVRSESSEPEIQTGKKFLVAFSEIIARYHPTPPTITFHAVGLSNSTQLTAVFNFNQMPSSHPVDKTRDFILDQDVELGKEELSKRTVLITSEENISLFATIQKSSSTQTLLIVPTDALGTKYFIPAAPSIAGTTDPPSDVTVQVTERSPFRIAVLNADADNKVTFKGDAEKEISLSRYEVAQVWLDRERGPYAVEAEAPVAVFFGHPCARRKPCTCGQLYTTVAPAKEDGSDFFIPPLLVDSASEESVVLASDASGASSPTPYNKDSPVVKRASAAILYSPGMLLTLIPESDFASCYVVGANPDIPSSVVIMAKADETDGVHVGTTQADVEWQEMKDTVYKTARHELAEGRSFIWHSYSKMAVYFIGEKDGSRFGHPAPIVSTTPDYRGCSLVPETLHVGDSAQGWRESLKYCSERDLELVSFSKASHLEQVNRWLAQRKTEDLTEVWIGMRRSSLNGEWYWADGGPVGVTNWAEREPGPVEEGQCAMMSIGNDGGFTWRDENCCRRAKPLCFGKGQFIRE